MVHRIRETGVARHSPLKVIRRQDGLVRKAAYTLANILFANRPCNTLTSWESGKLQMVLTEP